MLVQRLAHGRGLQSDNIQGTGPNPLARSSASPNRPSAARSPVFSRGPGPDRLRPSVLTATRESDDQVPVQEAGSPEQPDRHESQEGPHALTYGRPIRKFAGAPPCADELFLFGT